MQKEERITIFIIADNKMFALLLEKELKKVLDGTGHAIHLFENGELCGRFLHIKPQLVIVAHHLNSVNANAMNGLEVIEMIRTKNPDAGFIMFTRDEETSLFLRSQKAGAYDYPAKSNNLPHALELSLNQWLKMKENSKITINNTTHEN